MAVFIGTFENKVDRKGRVSIPAPFRQNLASLAFQGIVAYPSRLSPNIEACGMDLMEQMIADDQKVGLPGNAPQQPVSPIFYDLQQLVFDGQGRVGLPKSFCEFAGITEQAKFVGTGRFFQIWDPQRLTDFIATQQDAGGGQ